MRPKEGEQPGEISVNGILIDRLPGHYERDHRAPLGRRPDAQLASNTRCPFPHARKTEMATLAAAQNLLIDAGAVVPDFQAKPSSIFERDP